tara:strand:+ start:132 stop:983 length:852 start_codon:yes stop_codon:yes gene_type:complete
MNPRKPIFDIIRAAMPDKMLPFELVKELDKALDDAGVPMEPKVVTPKRGSYDSEKLSFAQSQVDVGFLKVAFPTTPTAVLQEWVEPIRAAMYRWGIDTFREVASFLANIGEESAGLTRLEENLNYSTKALLQLFGRHRITYEEAHKYGRKKGQKADQVALANILYGGEWGRINLGNLEYGDGWKHRGFGPKQITGRSNQTRFAEAMGMSVEEGIEYLKTKEGGMMGAGWFWFSHGLDAKAATPGVRDDRIAVNGGTFGLANVERTFNKLIEELLRREESNAKA